MVISKADRRAARATRAQELFGEDAAIALDLLELVELAWHDCYDEEAHRTKSSTTSGSCPKASSRISSGRHAWLSRTIETCA
jgi:hypothetical protein